MDCCGCNHRNVIKLYILVSMIKLRAFLHNLKSIPKFNIMRIKYKRNRNYKL